MAPAASVARAEVRDIVLAFEGVGTVESPQEVQVAAKTSGRIQWLQAREGDRVAAGQVLVRMDPAEVEAAVRREQAVLGEARSRLAQAEIGLGPTEAAIVAGVRTQEAALASAEADLRQARETFAAQEAAARSAVAEAESRVQSAVSAAGAAEAAVRSAQASLANARARLERVGGLYRQGFIAAQDVDDSRTAAQVQEQAVEGARNQLESARAQREASQAQKSAAERQVEVVQARGRADVAAARARVEQARAALDQARANRANRSAYAASLRALRANVAAAEAAVRQAESRRADMVLSSPLSGYVTARHLDPGAMATPGAPILTVQSLREVWVNLPVPEEASRKVRLGQEAEARFDALPGEVFRGRIVQIVPAADPQSRRVTVRIGLPNPGRRIKPGMSARGRLVTDRLSGVVTVPREALQRGRDGVAVLVVDAQGVARRRRVRTGLSDSRGVAVLGGLQPGEQVIVLSAAPVKDGAKVRVGGDPGPRPGAARRPGPREGGDVG